MAKETAEQKLLKLIELSDAQGIAATPKPAAAKMADPQQVLQAVQSVGGAVSLPASISGLLASIKNFIGLVPRDGGLGLREVNAILAVAVVMVVIIFGLNVSSGFKRANAQIVFEQPEGVSFSPGNLLPQFKALQDYVGAISFRNIFQPYEKKVVEAQTEEQRVVKMFEQIDSKTKGLRLVGVSWFDSPQSASAMVENTDSGVTYFLRSGEKVNGVTVEAIYSDSIVLEFLGERLELKL
ncbi:MAG TPA: hypothetical protein VLJ10_00135 [Candidatus Bathyarchaeia archaeon]|nr:hypothetical protein [Candidatus Bathyarchaeia archaeon]